MREYINATGHVSYEWAGGWLPLVGVTERDRCRAEALAVVEQVGLVDLPLIPHAPSAGMRALDRGGVYYDRARWMVAFEGTLAWFDLPWGTRWVPCVITGVLIDAWTADAEHLIPVDLGGEGVVGNLALADHGANRGKSARPVHPATLARWQAVTGALPTVKRGTPGRTNPVDQVFNYFDRRPRGVMDSTRWQG